jgi:hypothetical protein
MFVLLVQTERFDQMSEQQQHSPASLFPLVALCERIEAEAPHLQIKGLYEFPRPFIKVKDTVHGIVVGFSSEDDYVTYLQIVSRMEVKRHA